MAKPKKTSANPRKAPAQDRSRATVEVILDAAARILVKDGYEVFTTNRVADRAGVSVGSLYQYFPNKEALIGELMRRHVQDLEQGIEEMVERAATAPLAEIVRGAIEHNVQSHLIDPDLHRVLSEEVPRLGELDWQAGFVERMSRHVRKAFEARRTEIIVGDLDLAVYLVCKTVDSVVHNAAQDRRGDLKSGLLAEELTRMIVSYLTGKPLALRRALRNAAE